MHKYPTIPIKNPQKKKEKLVFWNTSKYNVNFWNEVYYFQLDLKFIIIFIIIIFLNLNLNFVYLDF